MLGSLTPIPTSLVTDHASLFLGITVGTDDEMTPRVQLGSVPFAVQALTVPDGSITSAKLNIDNGLAVNGNLGVNGVANSNYEGFSYYTTGYPKPAQWNPIVVDTLDFNTFGTNTYDTSTGTFTAPKAGYYSFRTHGFIRTAGTANERVSVGIYINNTLRALSGGQFSAYDTPGPQFAHVVYLQRGDTVRVYSYTPIDAIFGLPGGHQWWFQGEYVGK
jgi:hypothetical protein